jgi:hypothetical protein
MKKTKTRLIAEKIKKLTGTSLIKINFQANQLIQMGLYKTKIEALNELLDLAKDNK